MCGCNGFLDSRPAWHISARSFDKPIEVGVPNKLRLRLGESNRVQGQGEASTLTPLLGCSHSFQSPRINKHGQRRPELPDGPPADGKPDPQEPCRARPAHSRPVGGMIAVKPFGIRKCKAWCCVQARCHAQRRMTTAATLKPRRCHCNTKNPLLFAEQAGFDHRTFLTLVLA
jgi:hypothetical protein